MLLDEMTDVQTGGRLALDIETISPELSYSDYPDFDDPGDFELLATAMGYEPPQSSGAGLSEGVLWRDGLDVHSELSHVQDVAEVILELEPSEIITYNGDEFDFWLLLNRAKMGGEEVNDRTAFESLRKALNSPQHIDLKPPAWDAYGDYTSLEDLVENQGLTVRRTFFEDYDHGHSLAYRPPSEPPYVESSDIPVLGEAVLRSSIVGDDSVNVEVATDMLTDYAVGDIEHLLTLSERRPF